VPGKMTDALTRIARTGRLSLTGTEMAAWRLAQPGKHKFKRNQVRDGWTQAMAAQWYGCSTRQWRRWETAETDVPLPVVKAILRYSSSMQSVLDRIMEV